MSRVWLGRTLAVVLFSLLVGKKGRAADEWNPQLDEARRLYTEAQALFVAGKCNEAMPLLLRANKLTPSPNSNLLIARCLVAEGKRAQAATLYAEVERDALNQVRSGETRYGETAAAAAKEGTALRAKLGTLRVRLAPRAGVALEVDGAPTEIHSSAETIAYHDPGQAQVTFILPSSRKDKHVLITAGKDTIVTYEPDAPPPPPSRALPWTFYPSAGLTVVGLGAFTGFGLASESTYGDLERRCSPSCGDQERSDADQGRTYQTLANVGLVVGLTFAVTTVVILLTR